jgi:hypothetical protein
MKITLLVACGLVLFTAGILVPFADAGPIGQLPSAMIRLVTENVQEPGTMLLLGTFLLGLGAVTRRVFWTRGTPRGVGGREVGPARGPYVPRTPPESVLVGGRDNQGDVRYMPQS